MKRGGVFAVWVLILFFLLSGFSSSGQLRLQESETESETPAVSDLFLSTPTESETPTESPAVTETETPEPAATETSTVPAPAPQVIISEVAWAGTAASANDEWIELWNPTPTAADLSGWVLTDGGDISIALGGTIGAGRFFLLERSDDTTVGNIQADRIYTGALSNAGEALVLYNASGNAADSVNADGGPWPAGQAVPYGTMERMGDVPASDSAWCSNDGIHRSGLDARGNPINGTPREGFSGYCAQSTGNTPSLTLTPTVTGSATGTETPTPTLAFSPTANLPQSLIISEVAWGGTAASSSDEWIELYSPDSSPIDLAGWVLTDGGDIRITLSGTVGSGEYVLLERTDDDTIVDITADRIYTGNLSNGGEVLQLLDPAGRVIDTANGDGGPWPAGASAPVPISMERISIGPETDSSWCSNDGVHRNGTDATGNPVSGTPRSAFSGFCSAAQSTGTPTPTAISMIYPMYSVVINEVAWAGTEADPNDEWIELWNPGSDEIPLWGWVLTDGGDIRIALEGSIPPGGFFLLERGADDSLVDISANQIYAGNLSNAGESLLLLDPAGTMVDAAGEAGRPWPAGSASPVYASMERAEINPPAWVSNTGWVVNGNDAQGYPVRGTPGRTNSALYPAPTPAPIPKGILINEFLPKPGSDWNGDGKTDVNDEFIELLNTSARPADLGGWKLDDALHGGSHSYTIPPGTVIGAGEFKVFFRSQTHIALNDNGDEVWLLAPDGMRVDGTVYTRTRWPDSGWDRYPDGESVLRLGFPPTPGEPNRLPPDLLNTGHEPQPTTVVGWRTVDCKFDDGPILVGDGFLTTGGEESAMMAESFGYIRSRNGVCFAWASPRSYGVYVENSPYENRQSWWWDWYILR
jgi:hypothetical protein